MELSGVGVQNVSGFCAGCLRNAGIYLPVFRRTVCCRKHCSGLAFGSLAGISGFAGFAGSVVDRNTGLHIVAEHIKQDSLPVIFHGFCFHDHAVTDQVFTGEDGRDAVQYMISGFFDVIGSHVFKGKHTIYVEIASPCNQIFFIGIFTGKLEADEMAAVI